MSELAIGVKDIVVRYLPYLDVHDGRVGFIRRVRGRRIQPVTALDGVSFDVERGEAFGVIGANGAGKSTLLRVLAGTLEPEIGELDLHVSRPALLSLGTGFNGKLSGRENVYLGGLAAGLTRARVDEIYDHIVAFAGIGEAIDRPISTYSSGMRARLAFAIAIEQRPDFLLVDEVLSVGDADFKRRSRAAMRDMMDGAGTIVLVSHSLGVVSSFCDRALWLHEGQVKMVGPADEVVTAYRRSYGPAAPPSTDDEPWTTRAKTAAVLRLLGGEDIIGVAEDLGAEIRQLRRWRRLFLAGGRRSIATQGASASSDDDDDDDDDS